MIEKGWGHYWTVEQPPPPRQKKKRVKEMKNEGFMRTALHKFERSTYKMVVTRMDTAKYRETLKFVYLKYHLILVNSYQRFSKF